MGLSGTNYLREIAKDYLKIQIICNIKVSLIEAMFGDAVSLRVVGFSVFKNYKKIMSCQNRIRFKETILR